MTSRSGVTASALTTIPDRFRVQACTPYTILSAFICVSSPSLLLLLLLPSLPLLRVLPCLCGYFTSLLSTLPPGLRGRLFSSFLRSAWERRSLTLCVAWNGRGASEIPVPTQSVGTRKIGVPTLEHGDEEEEALCGNVQRRTFNVQRPTTERISPVGR